MIVITEGSAKIVSESHVFYNRVQQFNRDLSLSVLTTYSRIAQAENERKENTNIDKNSAETVSRILNSLKLKTSYQFFYLHRQDYECSKHYRPQD